MASEMSGLSVKDVTEMLCDMENLAPTFCGDSEHRHPREILAPPVSYCLNGCKYLTGVNKGQPRSLLWHFDPTDATLYTIHGETIKLEVVTLRCKACESRFGYQNWSRNGEFFFYENEREYVKVTQSVYVPRSFARFVSNTVYHDHGTYEGIAATFQNSFAGYEGFTRQIVSLLFLRHEVECDLTEGNQRGYAFKLGDSILQYIPHIIPEIFAQIYPHQCSDRCCKKNCGYLFVADGLWKMGFRHCRAAVVVRSAMTAGRMNDPGVWRGGISFWKIFMVVCCLTRRIFKQHPSALRLQTRAWLGDRDKVVPLKITRAKNTVNNVPLIRFPNVCTNACKGLSEYCAEHEWMGSTISVERVQSSSSEMLISGGGRLLAEISSDINVLLAGELDQNAETLECTEFNPDKQCTKDKGAEGRSYRYSRGYLFVVRCTGHIEAFGPIFRAESLGQVFLFIIAWLHQRLQTGPRDQWKKVFLAYDNICQLSRVKAAREKLPLPAPYDQMWEEISRIVDGLHIQNHKDPRCKVLYDPARYFSEHPEMKTEKVRNTMAAEQTFSWLANFRKQANAIPKERQIFFVHRLIVRRNAYLSRCLASRAKPVGGGIRGFADRGNRN